MPRATDPPRPQGDAMTHSPPPTSTRRGRRPGIRTALLAAVIAVIAAAPAPRPAIGQQPSYDIRSQIASLDAPTIVEREQATRLLVEIGLTAEDVQMSGVDPTSLSAEQRMRLDAALFERFRSEPRAGLGVQFDQGFPTGVRLQLVVPNFPASRVLLAGDIIEQADGALLTGTISQQAWLSLRHRILAHEPGETMRMVIRRDGRALTLDVPLGSYSDLGNAAPLTPEDLAAAWDVRREAAGFSLRDPGRIAPPNTGDPWSRMTPADESRLLPNLGLIAGGTPGARAPRRLDAINAAARRAESFRLQQQQHRVIRQGDGQIVVQIGPQPADRPEALRRNLIMQIQQWESVRNDARDRAMDPALTDLQRAQLASQLTRAEDQLAVLRQRLAELDGR